MDLKYCVDGYEFDDLESNQAGDGEFAPFQIFDITGQKYLLGTFSTRADAERICAVVVALDELRDFMALEEGDALDKEGQDIAARVDAALRAVGVDS